MICAMWGVFTALPWAGLNSWDCSFSFRRAQGSNATFEWLMGGLYFHQSPAEEIHCSCAEPAKLWCQHTFSPVEHNNWHHKSPLTDFLFPLGALCTCEWDSSCRHCTPVLSWFAVGRSVAVGFAGSFPHPSPSWSKAGGVFPKCCSAGFCRISHTEPRQMN